MVKLLKSPNSPNIGVAGLNVEVVLETKAEILPRIEVIVLSRTPIVVISKTTNIS